MWYRVTIARIGTVTAIVATATGGITHSVTVIAAIGIHPDTLMDTGAITTADITASAMAID